MKFLSCISYYGLYIPYDLEVQGVKIEFTYGYYASIFLVQSYWRTYGKSPHKSLNLQFDGINNHLKYDL